MNISVSEPAKIDEIKVNIPTITVTPPMVSTDVFTDYDFSDREGKPVVIKGPGSHSRTHNGNNNVYYGGAVKEQQAYVKESLRRAYKEQQAAEKAGRPLQSVDEFIRELEEAR